MKESRIGSDGQGLRSGVSVIIPAYNSEASLAELVARLAKVLPPMCEGNGWEIILINDGSRDMTWEVIQTLARENPSVRGLNLMRNFGQHNALLCGIREAEFDVTVTMDDDLQHPPEAIPTLVAGLTSETDVVYGSPERQQHGLLRNAASFLTKLALKGAMGVPAARNVSAFRAFRTRLRRAFETYSAPFLSLDVLLTWGTDRFAVELVPHEPRRSGASNYTMKMLLTHALNMITGYTTLPLRIASWVGFVFTFFGVVALAYVVIRYLVAGGSVPGFPFLASIISIFSGATLFSLGIMGEYLARMHTRMMDQPSYVIRTAVPPTTRRGHARSDV